jgi:hypothetical protein
MDENKVLLCSNDTYIVTCTNLAEMIWIKGGFGSSTRSTHFKLACLENSHKPRESLQVNSMEAGLLTEELSLAIVAPSSSSILQQPFTTFRSCGWIVKNGLHYGCDFVLYRNLPDLCHSEYCVSVISSNQQLSALACCGRMRVAEHSRKRMLLCNEDGDCLQMKRWVMKQHE